MENNQIILEKLFDATIDKVWGAITNKDEMKNWYFELDDFKPVVGFQFQFYGGHKDGMQYLHLCEVIEVIPQKKLTYSWRYGGYSGISFVTFDLQKKGNQTLLKLIHTGIESFPTENPDFAMHNFEEGWSELLNIRLRKQLEGQNFQHQLFVDASPEKVFESLTKRIPFWWTEMFEGASDNEGEFFTVRFGSSVFKTMRVEELIRNKKVVWFVTDTLIDIPELSNKMEWLNTKIVWELLAEDTNTQIRITHFGLNPNIECYEICSAGWRQFCDSLKSYLEKGSGTPFEEQKVKI
jgi:uncharacterized protein YndB with AHSA1/START domain